MTKRLSAERGYMCEKAIILAIGGGLLWTVLPYREGSKGDFGVSVPNFVQQHLHTVGRTGRTT